MFDDIDVAVVAVAEKKTETFLLVNFYGGNEERPERIRRDVDFHESPDCWGILAVLRAAWELAFWTKNQGRIAAALV